MTTENTLRAIRIFQHVTVLTMNLDSWKKILDEILKGLTPEEFKDYARITEKI